MGKHSIELAAGRWAQKETPETGRWLIGYDKRGLGGGVRCSWGIPVSDFLLSWTGGCERERQEAFSPGAVGKRDWQDSMLVCGHGKTKHHWE